ncbi:high frequency lysogenization protein HflD [Xylella fastidiosa]|uniref:High frequency lysogenization protein HflD homolog n=1 Tax=Xylella fastidiosa subsp. fastidiosa TaxID=644356 RepID=A0AAJ5UJE7_XYLFS|nr:high frequency lysogenization protein HflD [Xylella fastidiosa]WCF28944.1 high frequency lysogenization protein HflD [Xylella fastidiosa subsp. fastidiosa]
MNALIDNRVLALAGVVQALQQVRQIAETGQSETSAVRTAIDSVLRIDAESPEAVYGGIRNLTQGLQLLHDYFGNQLRDQLLPRLTLAVLQLERRFIRDTSIVAAVSAGITQAAHQVEQTGDSAHPEVLSTLGALYANTISHLRPRIIVQGNPHYLGQAGVVAEIRAMLLAALRSAVLWRQLNGNLLDFLLTKRAMAAATKRALR